MKRISIALLLSLSFFFITFIEPGVSFSSSGSTEKNMDKPVENLKVDVLVIGGGGGGLAAAAVAKGKLRDKGKVLIVEKRAVTGGNTINIYSPFIPPGTKSASNPAPDLSPDEQVERANEWSHYRVDSRLIRVLAEKSKNKDWLWELLSDEEKEKRIKEAEKESSMKFHDMERYATAMTELVHELGVEILLSTPAKKLLTDKSGAVIGAIAEGKDKNYKITATAVIIATGGFIGNNELMEKYFHSYSDNLYEEFYVRGQMYTGDGLLMAAEVGASVDAPTAYEWEINLMPYLAPGGDQSSGGGQGQQTSISLGQLLDNDRYPETIWINAKGQRFTNESDLDGTNAIFQQLDMKQYTVFDESILEYMLNKQGRGGGGQPPQDGQMPEGGQPPEGGQMPMDGQPPEGGQMPMGGVTTQKTPAEIAALKADLDVQVKKVADMGYAIKADTLEEVAGFIGCDPEALKATIREYNEFCEKGHDGHFLKMSSALIPFAAPPYYAVRGKLAMLLTRGPIRVNEKMEVLNNDYDPIKGLYAAGVDIGATDNDTYAGNLPMHSSTWAISSGGIAGESAVEYILTKEK